MVTNIKLRRKDQIWEKSRVHFGNAVSSEVRAVLFKSNAYPGGHYESEF